MATAANTPQITESSKCKRFCKEKCSKKFGSKTTAAEVLKDVDLTGQTIVITGTTSGIGVETARSLALSGAHVVLANRNLSASEKQRQDIWAEASREGKRFTPKIDIIQVDLSSLKSVREAANEFISKGWPLHALVLNAGVLSFNGEKSADGHERTFAVNHLGHFYLAQLLMEKLRESAPSRLVVVSSNLHAKTGIRASEPLNSKLEKLVPTPTNQGGFNSAVQLYNNSKLNNMLFAKKVHRDEHSKGVNVYVLHPGVIRTELGRDRPTLYSIMTFFMSPFLKSTEQGAATTVYCAAHPDVASDSGKYYVDCAECTERLSLTMEHKSDKALVDDERLQDALWDRSSQLIRDFEARH